MSTPSWAERLKVLIVGGARDPHDKKLFHNLSLAAVLAWVGLGADGLSSSCYGPEQTFLALGQHHYLGIFVALATAVTIFIISASYSQIIEVFPGGGGGYLVASKLLSPAAGVFSGCALLVDYVLTIAISVASSSDALFSMLPSHYQEYKVPSALLMMVLLTVLNLRGAKESVIPMVPVFMIFIATHVFAIGYTFVSHAGDFSTIATATATDLGKSQSELGFFGMLFLILRAYSLGAGTYTGIEAVSNGMPVLAEPKVKTAKKTMLYMAGSLSFLAVGLMLAYLLFKVAPAEGKTLNAVLFENMSASWNPTTAWIYITVTLLSEGLLLLIAAQAGFLDGPRVMASMAVDRWFPIRFAMLSDRFVTQNGIIVMGGCAILITSLAHGSVAFLVVLYSINVFITFSLSQLGMVRHWWNERKQIAGWQRKLAINGVGLALTSFILLSLTIIKFHEGGWITLLITGMVVGVAFLIRRHYRESSKQLERLNMLVEVETIRSDDRLTIPEPATPFDPTARTAVMLVNGFNGLGLHTLLLINRLFPGIYKNFVFITVGAIDAGNFKGAAEIDGLEHHCRKEVDRYVDFMKRRGVHAEGYSRIGTDVLDEVTQLAPQITEKYPNSVFFGGQLVFREDSFLTRLMHNNIVFAAQRQFYHMGIPFIVLPVRV